MDKVILLENRLTAWQYCNLKEAVGFGVPTTVQAQKGIENSIYLISAYVDGEVVGMGRLVGDGAIIFYIQDLCIKPEFQSKGIGKLIVEKLLQYIKSNSIPNTKVTVGLMAAKGKEKFYEKLGFRIRPNDKEGSGMMLNIDI
jgi:GNAT superfamily N-acetyltransferase